MRVLPLILFGYSSIIFDQIHTLDSIRSLIDYLFLRSESYSPLFDIHVLISGEH